MSEVFDEFMAGDHRRGSHVTIFGEGYGPGIQKGGGDYAPAQLFRMFDVLYHWRGDGYPGGLNSWAMQETVDMIAGRLNVDRAPVIHDALSVDEILYLVSSHLYSEIARLDGNRPDVLAEGIIARSDPYLYTQHGSRVMFKLKAKDLA